MDILQAVILGIVQGITEWLPVSSSGHLAIVEHLFGLKQPLLFDVMLHFGSLIVVMIFFRKEIFELIKGIIAFDKSKLKLLLMIIVASIPIAVVGLLFKDFIEYSFRSLKIIGIALLITSLLLFLSKYPVKKNKKLGFFGAFVIGLFQALAVFPGISRSGSTISSGMLLGIKKEDVAKFSFLIFIPAIVGALILNVSDISEFNDLTPIIIGTVVSAVVGYFSLRLLMNVIKKDKFRYFSIYCLILGIVLLFLK